MLVGDAASQVNPLTGGGIIAAMEAGLYAGEIAASAVREGDYSAKKLAKYQDRCEENIQSKFKRDLKVKDYLLTLSDEELNSIADAFQDIELDNINTAELIKNLVKVSPKALLKLGKLF
jgi:digeranylgeranylglycerophospholipid reductase